MFGWRARVGALPGPAKALSAENPSVVVLAHTASSYTTGFAKEPALILAHLARSGAPAPPGPAPPAPAAIT